MRTLTHTSINTGFIIRNPLEIARNELQEHGLNDTLAFIERENLI